MANPSQSGAPQRRATKIHGFIRRQGKWLVDENGDEWFIRGGSFDGGVLGGCLLYTSPSPRDTR